MTLTEPQSAALASWVASGLKLSEIQRQLNSDFGLNLTYMEVRFLVDDHKLNLKDAERPSDLSTTLNTGNPPPSPTNPPGTASPFLSSPPPPQALNTPDPLPSETQNTPSGGVSLTVDQVTRPGTLVSGSVRFSDGQVANWYLDQTGRLGLVPSQKGYRPPQQDIEEFQLALERELARLGM
jgi:hypothetical protein